MDPTVLVIVLAVGMPLAVVVALAKAAQLRGPAPRGRESRQPVGPLVTDVVPEEHPDDADPDDDRPIFAIDSPPPEPDPGLRER
jgi:hypothetical protein